MSLNSKQKWLLASPIGKMLPDRIYLRWKFRVQMGSKLHLCRPVTYNEKLQWLKIHDHRSEYPGMVDKYLVKNYVSERIGAEHVVPLLGVWDSPEQIDFSSLPESFVLKCTHDSGGVFVVRDKSKADENAIKAALKEGISHHFYDNSREWAYKFVDPRIIAEKCLPGEINDYKFFCFDGKPEYMFIATGREDKTRETCFDFYDMDFNHIDVTNGHPNAPVPPEKPQHWDEMKQLAAKLSAGIPHVRVDFYESGGELYFGEFTFFHWGGFVPFKPADLDVKMGDLLNLPKKK